MLAFLSSRTGLAVVAGLVAVLLLAGLGVRINDRAYERGRADLVAEQAAVLKEKTDAANHADDAARRCAADSRCRLQDDGYRRD